MLSVRVPGAQKSKTLYITSLNIGFYCYNSIMKIRYAVLPVVMSLMLTLCSSCSKPVAETTETTEETTEETTVETTVLPTETTMDEDLVLEFAAVNYEITAPVVGDEEGNVKSVQFFRDGMTIKGRLTLPEGSGPFRTIIISGGLYSRLGRYTSKAEGFSERGYAVVEFDFLNGAPPPDYKDPDYIGDFIFEQILDLNAVLDSLAYIPEVDLANVYIYGHSMGGLVASYVGTERQYDLMGLVLADPSFYATSLMSFEHEKTITKDIHSIVAKCDIPVVIITGTKGSFGEDPHFFDKDIEAFPHCEYVVVEGADHHMNGEPGKKVVERAVEVMESWGKRYTPR